MKPTKLETVPVQTRTIQVVEQFVECYNCGKNTIVQKGLASFCCKACTKRNYIEWGEK